MYEPQQKFMERAVELAREAYKAGDYAIGSVIVKDDAIIGQGMNRIKLDANSIQHAEMVAIQKAHRTLGSRHLVGSVLYTTHEPCPMCASAAVWARLDGIVSGSRLKDMIEYATNNGNDDWSWRTIDISAVEVLNKGVPKLFFIEDFMREECLELFHSTAKEPLRR